jgi:hypothetical protein
MNMSIYTDNDYASRKDYLLALADEYGIDISHVVALAQLLGPNEDFDGLVTSIEDGIECGMIPHNY